MEGSHSTEDPTFFNFPKIQEMEFSCLESKDLLDQHEKPLLITADSELKDFSEETPSALPNADDQPASEEVRRHDGSFESVSRTRKS